ncbi:MAG TPA: STAS domain-containing protein [Acidimicrobiales bacterium]|nr:STAS domain-containing protein [Acidimicrobiales bacterium]
MTIARVEVDTAGGSLLIRLSGDVDLANARAVEAELRHVITNQVVDVTIDLTDVAYLGSAGVRVLFHLADRLAVLQIGLALDAPVGSPARRVIDLSGLGAVVPVGPPARGRAGTG